MGLTGPVRIVVPDALARERVDRALALLAGVSRAEASRIVAEGRVRVGGSRVSGGARRLHPGDLMEVEPPAIAPEEAEPPPAPGTMPVPLEARVVFADSDLVVVDKPAGLVVHPGAGNPEGTLVQQLLRLFPDIAAAGPAGDRPGVVQRLDKGTSGLLVVARTPEARQGLIAQLSGRSAQRRYLAVVHGELQADEGLVEAPLGRSPAQRLKMAVVEGGREARTRYSTMARSPAPIAVTLVSCRLETGRTHQVRAHFAAIGHAVLGDDRYSKPTQLAEARRTVPSLERPWLHATELGFVHPTTGEELHFTSVPPAELLEVLSRLGLPSLGLQTVGLQTLGLQAVGLQAVGLRSREESAGRRPITGGGPGQLGSD
jgi:23S rRNA pseudouridine1911/1915/1917 synthase